MKEHANIFIKLNKLQKKFHLKKYPLKTYIYITEYLHTNRNKMKMFPYLILKY